MIIKTENERHVDRFKDVPPNPFFIAGFIDVDGCRFIRHLHY